MDDTARTIPCLVCIAKKSTSKFSYSQIFIHKKLTSSLQHSEQARRKKFHSCGLWGFKQNFYFEKSNVHSCHSRMHQRK